MRARSTPGRAAPFALALVLGSCGPSPLALSDAGPAALSCATPQRIDLVAPTSGANSGIPMAGITWPGDHCVLSTDEHAPGMVLLIADFTGTALAYLTANAGSSWVIDTSTTGSGPTSYLVNIPRDTDITVQMHDASASVSITFRVEASTLVLLDMHRL